MSEGILVFLAIVLLLKELGVFQAIKRFFNEVNDETKKDEKSSDEVKETVEEDEDNEINEENVGSEDNIGSEVDSNVEEASEESFEDNECSDKEPEKSEKEEPKKNDHVIMFEFENKYPRLIYIDERTSRIEESPKDFFYCFTQDMPKIRMMPEKEQIEYLRMRRNQIRSLQI